MSDPNPARILIVDDDVAHAESLQDALELDGYLCTCLLYTSPSPRDRG